MNRKYMNKTVLLSKISVAITLLQGNRTLYECNIGWQRKLPYKAKQMYYELYSQSLIMLLKLQKDVERCEGFYYYTSLYFDSFDILDLHDNYCEYLIRTYDL